MAKLCDPAGFSANTVKGLTCNLIDQCIQCLHSYRLMGCLQAPQGIQPVTSQASVASAESA